MKKLIKAIKEFFKREVHYNTTNSAASCCTWRDGVVLLLPSGECYYMRYDIYQEQPEIMKIRLGY